MVAEAPGVKEGTHLYPGKKVIKPPLPPKKPRSVRKCILLISWFRARNIHKPGLFANLRGEALARGSAIGRRGGKTRSPKIRKKSGGQFKVRLGNAPTRLIRGKNQRGGENVNAILTMMPGVFDRRSGARRQVVPKFVREGRERR